MAIGVAWVDGAWVDAGWVTGAWNQTATVTAALSGTVTDDTEEDVRAGGSTILLTLVNDTWVLPAFQPVGTNGVFQMDSGPIQAVGTHGILGLTPAFAEVRQAIIDGLDSAGAETLGWNNEVRDALDVSTVVRTSDTVVTVTLPAFANYDITANETITATVPASALAKSTSAVIASPTFTITFVADAATTGGWHTRGYVGDEGRERRIREERERLGIIPKPPQVLPERQPAPRDELSVTEDVDSTLDPDEIRRLVDGLEAMAETAQREQRRRRIVAMLLLAA